MDNVEDKVLDFYRSCPFNSVSSSAEAAEQLMRTNIIELSYPDLHRRLKTGLVKSVLEVGCGVGWLSITATLYYQVKVLGVDLNPAAISIATEIVSKLNLANLEFSVGNVFNLHDLNCDSDLVISIGMLHHTGNPQKGISNLIAKLTSKPCARLYLGLYHSYGREPFLRLFQNLQDQGKSEEELFQVFREMHPETSDLKFLWSRFRDQVLHPHESQHSLKEVCDWLDIEGMVLESTSINRFMEVQDLEELYQLEKTYKQLSEQRNLLERKYFPGFFTVCARRR